MKITNHKTANYGIQILSGPKATIIRRYQRVDSDSRWTETDTLTLDGDYTGDDWTDLIEEVNADQEAWDSEEAEELAEA